MSLMTGKANTSTVFHELFHHIATDLPESQFDAFKSHFSYDPLNPVKFQEDMAEAFEEFMRLGMAPTLDLHQIFLRMKDQLIRTYQKLKGTPLEETINPDLRRLLEETMGKEVRKLRSVSISPHAVSAVGVGTRAKARLERKDASQEREFPIATKYPFIE